MNVIALCIWYNHNFRLRFSAILRQLQVKIFLSISVLKVMMSYLFYSRSFCAGCWPELSSAICRYRVVSWQFQPSPNVSRRHGNEIVKFILLNEIICTSITQDVSLLPGWRLSNEWSNLLLHGGRQQLRNRISCECARHTRFVVAVPGAGGGGIIAEHFVAIA